MLEQPHLLEELWNPIYWRSFKAAKTNIFQACLSQQEERQNDRLKVSLSPMYQEFQDGQLFIKKGSLFIM